MATEEFKQVHKELLPDYLELRNIMAEKGYANIEFKYKDYLDFYLEYMQLVNENLPFNDGEDDEDYSEDDEDLEYNQDNNNDSQNQEQHTY